ncbi:MAG: hypothetical protein CM1200mP16_14930 [Nitrospina sp.]|nr:MAG: hypothetical protein CM1200mP16_14930 [Nitrospina sp.]
MPDCGRRLWERGAQSTFRHRSTFLTANKAKAYNRHLYSGCFSVLWGFGMEIGHSSRTIKDCIKLANEELTIKTSMIETRFLMGDQTLYGRFTNSINKNVLKRVLKNF